MSRVKAVWQRFRQYLLEKQHYSSHDIIIAITYLGQIDFDDAEILQKICQNRFGKMLVEDFQLSEIPSEQPGYFNVSDMHLLLIRDEHDITRQIERRVLAERRRDFSVAMNHLINELEALCFAFDPDRPESIKKYNQESVQRFIEGHGALRSDLSMIPAIYKGRHSNSVSHPGSYLEPIQTVLENDYLRYKGVIGRFIKKILQAEHQIASSSAGVPVAVVS